jgi:hypothetical protein
MGNRKSIVMMPNGSVVVSRRYRNFYSLFDANGKFVKEFGIKNKSVKPYKEIEAIEGVMNNTFYTALDKMGKMLVFDFDGNYVRTLTLNYTTKRMIPMTNNKIAVAGWAIWKDRTRDFVAIVDYQTNEQKIIWDYFTPNNDGSLIVEKNAKGDVISLRTNTPNSDIAFIHPEIAFVNNQLIVALPHNGEVMIYDVTGKLKSKDKLGWEQKEMSVKEQKEMYRKLLEKDNTEDERKRFQSYGISGEVFDKWIAEQKANVEKISTPRPLPMFSNIIKDSDGNLLFFEMPETEGANKFHVWVYQNGGKFVCECSFECDDYDLSITPSKMVFHKGYIYALQTLKKANGVPLRLVRFKLN